MKHSLLIIMAVFLLSGCAEQRTKLFSPPSPPVQPKQKKEEDYSNIKKHSYRSRSKIPLSKSRYEGSLWQDEASWGNFLRDHRARFKGDLVKVIDINKMISIPKKEEPATVARPAVPEGETAALAANQALDAVTGQMKAEEEQNEVLSSLRSISAYVESVLPNGNMLITGVKVDYRQQSSIRYVTTIKGIIRPSDIDINNEVTAIKLARFETKIKRQVLARNYQALSPLIGTQKAGLLDRLSHIATPSKRR